MTNADRAKRSLAIFIADAQQIPIYAAEDLIDETQRICELIHEIPGYRGYFSIPAVLEDYLGIDFRYEWIFEPS